MSEPAELSFLTLPEALQDVFVRQRTGTLSVVLSGEVQRLLFLSGQLYLSGFNPLRERMERVFEGPADAYGDLGFKPAQYLERELTRFGHDLADCLASWESQDVRFEEDLGEVPDDIVGPVPTAALVMDLCSRGLTESELLRRLGGLDSRLRASEEIMLRSRVPELDRHEIGLLDRLEHTADVRTLIAEAGGQASGLLGRLARLQAVRLVVAESDAESSSRSKLSRDLLDDISRRVLASLDDLPLELDRGDHRASIGRLLREYGDQNYFELLNAHGSSSAEELHRNYMEVARLAHPVHAPRLGMTDGGRRLEWLFGRLTEAYLVLTNPDRAAEYRRSLGHVPGPEVPVPPKQQRRSEQVTLARHNYQLALGHWESGDYHSAIEMLRQSVRIDPQPEYWLLLGRCQRHNPKWLHMAVDSLRHAVALRPGDEVLRRELAETMREYGEQPAEHPPSEADTEADGPESVGLARKLISRLRRSSE